MLRKSDPLYLLDIRSVYPRVVGLVVSTALDKILFNTLFVTCAYYFIFFVTRLVVIQCPWQARNCKTGLRKEDSVSLKANK